MLKKLNWQYIKPPIVLAIICIISTALLVFAYNLTYVDTTGVITDKLKAGLEDVLGDGEYEMLLTKNDEGTSVPLVYDGITSIIKDDKGQTAFEITVDGYAKGGLHVLVGIDEKGAVSGVSILSIGETPGLGTKVQNQSFLDSFKGIDKTPVEVDSITGATYSSKGMKNAVSLALTTYQSEKGEILGEQ